MLKSSSNVMVAIVWEPKDVTDSSLNLILIVDLSLFLSFVYSGLIHIARHDLT